MEPIAGPPGLAFAAMRRSTSLDAAVAADGWEFRSPFERAYRHTALFYAGEEEFLTAALSFVVQGLEDDEAVLVAASRAKVAAMRTLLGADAKWVSFADMHELGANPARIIPRWRAFLDERGSTACPVRGIGEPIGASRLQDELIEAQLHEVLLNAAFADEERFWLLCPYDTDLLGESVLAEARSSHPYIAANGTERASDCYIVDDSMNALGMPLLPLSEAAMAMTFDSTSIGAVRRALHERAMAAGATSDEAQRLVLAANEAVTNSVRHADGRGVVQLWIAEERLVCEVRDAGRLRDPMAGRVQPPPEAESGRGLWIANQLCDLVQIRSDQAGNVVRLHMHINHT